MKAKTGERLPYLLAKLKAPRVLERLEQTAERARAESWPYEQFCHALSTVAHAETSAVTISVIIADLLARAPRVHAPTKPHEQARTRLSTGRARASGAAPTVPVQTTAAGSCSSA